MLAKEILSKTREEINSQCMEDLAGEIKKKQAQIDEFTRSIKKASQNVEYTLGNKIEAQPEQQPEESK